MRRKRRGPPSTAELLAALSAAAVIAPFVWSMNNTTEKRRKTGPVFRKVSLEREQRAKHRAAEQRAREERRQWFSPGAEGDLLLRAETERTLDVLPPYDDIERTGRGVGYPSKEYGWRSTSANAAFKGIYEFISARGYWTLTLDGETIGGEFKHDDIFLLDCPRGGFLSPTQETVIRRLLGGPGGPGTVVFSRYHDGAAIRDRLWSEHLARTEA